MPATNSKQFLFSDPIINDRNIPRKLFSRRSCDRQFRSIVWHRDGRCLRADVAAQRVAWRPFMALDQWNRSSLSGSGAVLSGDFEAVQSALASVRAAAAQGGESHCNGLGVLWHCAADWSDHASAGQGSAAPQTAAQGQEL